MLRMSGGWIWKKRRGEGFQMPTSSLGGVVCELGGKDCWSLEQERATSRERRVRRGRSLIFTEDGAEKQAAAGVP